MLWNNFVNNCHFLNTFWCPLFSRGDSRVPDTTRVIKGSVKKEWINVKSFVYPFSELTISDGTSAPGTKSREIDMSPNVEKLRESLILTMPFSGPFGATSPSGAVRCARPCCQGRGGELGSNPDVPGHTRLYYRRRLRGYSRHQRNRAWVR